MPEPGSNSQVRCDTHTSAAIKARHNSLYELGNGLSDLPEFDSTWSTRLFALYADMDALGLVDIPEPEEIRNG